jgi:hypothetical protein
MDDEYDEEYEDKLAQAKRRACYEPDIFLARAFEQARRQFDGEVQGEDHLNAWLTITSAMGFFVSHAGGRMPDNGVLLSTLNEALMGLQAGSARTLLQPRPRPKVGGHVPRGRRKGRAYSDTVFHARASAVVTCLMKYGGIKEHGALFKVEQQLGEPIKGLASWRHAYMAGDKDEMARMAYEGTINDVAAAADPAAATEAALRQLKPILKPGSKKLF